jgi:hypothetical protein
MDLFDPDRGPRRGKALLVRTLLKSLVGSKRSILESARSTLSVKAQGLHLPLEGSSSDVKQFRCQASVAVRAS